MKLRAWASLTCLFGVVGCANPVNQVTADNYQETCFVAEQNGSFAVAEEACSRALANVNWGNLGPAEQSQKLYNLARIKRKLAKFSEAEQLLRQSLEIEENFSPPSELRMGRRQVELAVALAAQGRWTEGLSFLTRAYGAQSQFSAAEKEYFTLVLNKYAEEFQRQGNTEEAARLKSMALNIGS